MSASASPLSRYEAATFVAFLAGFFIAQLYSLTRYIVNCFDFKVLVGTVRPQLNSFVWEAPDMSVLLLLGAIGASLLGVVIFGASKSAVHEIEAFVMFLIGTVSFVGFAILQALEKRTHPISAADAADFNAWVKAQGKVGITVNSQDGRTIESVSANSAAAEAGVMQGDRIVAIEGELCEVDYRAVVSRLVGAPGTAVRITARRGEDPIDFNLTRK